MDPIAIRVPAPARILFNSLYRSRDRSHLTQGLLAIALPDDRFIDVSWYPEYEQEGEYTITVYRHSWDNQELEYEKKDVDEVVTLVERLVESFLHLQRAITWTTQYQVAINTSATSSRAIPMTPSRGVLQDA
jgi:hypothetical protein